MGGRGHHTDGPGLVQGTEGQTRLLSAQIIVELPGLKADGPTSQEGSSLYTGAELYRSTEAPG